MKHPPRGFFLRPSFGFGLHWSTQRLGEYLLGVGAALCLVLAWKLMWGRIRIERTDH